MISLCSQETKSIRELSWNSNGKQIWEKLSLNGLQKKHLSKSMKSVIAQSF